MATTTEQKPSLDARVERVIHICLFNVLLSALPFVLLYLFHEMVGISLTADEYTPDFLLVIISISCNMLGSTTNGKPYVSKAISTLLRGVILISIFAGFAFYFGLTSRATLIQLLLLQLRNHGYPELATDFLSLSPDNITILWRIAFVVVAINTVIGIFFEVRSLPGKKVTHE